MTNDRWSAVAIHPDDDVAVAMRAIEPGEARMLRGADVTIVTIVEPIALGHKFAVRAIAAGERVKKYGDPIGVATCDIAEGAHVHVHNLRSDRARKAN